MRRHRTLTATTIAMTRAATSLAAATTWITADAVDHGDHLPGVVGSKLGVSRPTALRLLRQLEAAQWLQREGSGRNVVWRPGQLRQVVRRYDLTGLQEDLPWRRDFAPYFTLDDRLRRIAQHAFTELVNNAVDHSGGQAVTISMRQTATHLQLLVSDDGCGLFRQIADAFEIYDPELAMFELSKGKLTSQPSRHCGHGLYFTSRLADVFHIHANQSAFQYRDWAPGCWQATRPSAHAGTSIFFALALDTPRTLDEVLRAHSADLQGYGFERTRLPMRLLAGSQSLASRADARRVTARLDEFREAELDFSGIEEIGHAFADELFRVYGQAHPHVALRPVGMKHDVALMVDAIVGNPLVQTPLPLEATGGPGDRAG